MLPSSVQEAMAMQVILLIVLENIYTCQLCESYYRSLRDSTIYTFTWFFFPLHQSHLYILRD
uniref:Uncharacterized protein n=1 Tax=Cannabis sativa TaxID=3483 RepID=A0A803R851_CANSA